MSEKLIQEILLKMNYDPSMTLKENIQLLEQPEGVMDRRTFIASQNAKALGMSQGEYEKKLQQQASKSLDSFKEFITDPHVFLPVAAIGVGLLTGGVGGFVLGGLIELADAAIYYKEGKPEEFGIALVFALIPGIMKLLPKKFTSEVVKNFLKKLKLGGPLNKIEQELAQWIESNKNWLVRESLKYANRHYIKTLISKCTLRQSIGLMLYLMKLGVISAKYSVMVPVVVVGGGYVLFTIVELASKLGVSIMGVDTRNVKLSPQQEKVPVKNIIADTNRIKTQFIKEVDEKVSKIDSTQLHQEVGESLPKFDSKIDSVIRYNRKSVQTSSDTSKPNQ